MPCRWVELDFLNHARQCCLGVRVEMLLQDRQKAGSQKVNQSARQAAIEIMYPGYVAGRVLVPILVRNPDQSSKPKYDPRQLERKRVGRQVQIGVGIGGPSLLL